MNDSKVSHDNRKLLSDVVRASKRDNPYLNSLTINQYLVLKESEVLYKSYNHLTPELFDMLTLVCRLFKKSHKALTSYVIAKLLHPDKNGTSILMNVRHKLDRLVLKGYAEVIFITGRSKGYIPTEKAYKELSELIK